ncbi:MAG: response regulator transcription factor [Chloroflexi bacterium]|nr:response regulator transcription factor [Chloroflexota bacterium]
MAKLKILVVDDQPLLRHAVVEVLGAQENSVVVGEAENGVEALEKARELSPDLIVMDLEMPGMGGLQATKALQAEFPRIKILIFTASDAQSDLFSAMRAGARGYILKNAAAAEIHRAVSHIAEGGVIVSPNMATKLLEELPQQAEKTNEASGIEVLSKREAEVLEVVASGASNKEIASTLFVSENTVKTHMRHIMEKLHLANRAQAAAYGTRALSDLTPPDKP